MIFASMSLLFACNNAPKETPAEEPAATETPAPAQETPADTTAAQTTPAAQ